MRGPYLHQHRELSKTAGLELKKRPDLSEESVETLRKARRDAGTSSVVRQSSSPP